MVWSEFAEHCSAVYGSHVDYEEKFVLCPECGEPIYAIDYPNMMEDDEYVYCPVCEEGL